MLIAVLRLCCFEFYILSIPQVSCFKTLLLWNPKFWNLNCADHKPPLLEKTRKSADFASLSTETSNIVWKNFLQWAVTRRSMWPQNALGIRLIEFFAYFCCTLPKPCSLTASNNVNPISQQSLSSIDLPLFPHPRQIMPQLTTVLLSKSSLLITTLLP